MLHHSRSTAAKISPYLERYAFLLPQDVLERLSATAREHCLTEDRIVEIALRRLFRHLVDRDDRAPISAA